MGLVRPCRGARAVARPLPRGPRPGGRGQLRRRHSGHAGRHAAPQRGFGPKAAFGPGVLLVGAPGPPRVGGRVRPVAILGPARETDEPHPVGDYAATKLAGTELVREAAESGRVSATVLRVFNPLGAGAPPGSLVGRAVGSLQEALATGSQQIKLGALDSARDYIDVRDVARAALLASRRPYRPGQPMVLNVGRGIPVSSRWLVHRLAAIAHFDGEIVEESQASSTRSATVPWQWADTAAVRRELRWTPRHLLADSLSQAWSAATGTGPAHPPVAHHQSAPPVSASPGHQASSDAAPFAVPPTDLQSHSERSPQ